MSRRGQLDTLVAELCPQRRIGHLPAAHDEQDDEAAALYWPALQSVQAKDSTPVAALVRYFPAAHDEQDAEEGPLKVPAVHGVQLLVVYIGMIVCWRGRGCWGGVVLVLDSCVWFVFV